MPVLVKDALQSFTGIFSHALVDASRSWFDQMSENADCFNRFNDLLAGAGWHWRPDPLHQWSRRVEYPFVLANLPDAPATVLDAGGGITFFTHFLARRGYRMNLCDIDPLVAPLTDQISAKLSTSVAVTIAPLEKTPLPDSAFDAACCISVLEHVSDPAACVRELARVLRPGGRLLLTFDYEYRSSEGRRRAQSIVNEVESRFELPRRLDLEVLPDALTMRWHLAHAPERLWFEANILNRMRCLLGRIPDLVVAAAVGLRK